MDPYEEIRRLIIKALVNGTDWYFGHSTDKRAEIVAFVQLYFAAYRKLPDLETKPQYRVIFHENYFELNTYNERRRKWQSILIFSPSAEKLASRKR